MEAAGDVGPLLAVQNEDGLERLALDRLDQVLRYAGVVKPRGRQPCGSEDVGRPAGGQRSLALALDGLGHRVLG